MIDFEKEFKRLNQEEDELNKKRKINDDLYTNNQTAQCELLAQYILQTKVLAGSKWKAYINSSDIDFILDDNNFIKKLLMNFPSVNFLQVRLTDTVDLTIDDLIPEAVICAPISEKKDAWEFIAKFELKIFYDSLVKQIEEERFKTANVEQLIYFLKK